MHRSWETLEPAVRLATHGTIPRCKHPLPRGNELEGTSRMEVVGAGLHRDHRRRLAAVAIHGKPRHTAILDEAMDSHHVPLCPAQTSGVRPPLANQGCGGST